MPTALYGDARFQIAMASSDGVSQVSNAQYLPAVTGGGGGGGMYGAVGGGGAAVRAASGACPRRWAARPKASRAREESTRTRSPATPSRRLAGPAGRLRRQREPGGNDLHPRCVTQTRPAKTPWR